MRLDEPAARAPIGNPQRNPGPDRSARSGAAASRERSAPQTGGAMAEALANALKRSR
jgi:hypothetical protein